MRVFIRSVLILLVLSWTVPALSQAVAPPVRSVVDQNGVDITRRTYMADATDIKIGPDDHRGLQQKRQWISGWRQALVPKILGSGYNVTVTFNGTSAGFTYDSASNQYISDEADGSSLNVARTVYTAADGTVINFAPQSYLFDRSYPWAIGTSVVFPDGVTWTYQYESFDSCYNCTYYSAATRLLSITSSAGYRLSYSYAQTPLHMYGYPQPRDDIRWLTLTRVDATNLACSSGCVSQYVTYGWADTSYDVPRQLSTVTDQASNVTNYTYAGDVSGIRLTGFASNNVTINYAPSTTTVSSVIRGPLTWTYGQTSTTGTVTDPAGATRTVTFDGTYRVTKDEIRDSSANLMESTSFDYCTSTDVSCPVGLLKKVTAREGNAASFKYDARGNATETRLLAKPGTGLADIVSSAVYPSSCANMKTCNKPTSTTDARGATTTYSWNGNNGGLDSVTSPAVGGISPQTRYTYSQVQAYDAYSQPIGQPSWMLTQVSSCRTTSSCTNTPDEARTTTTYASAGTPNNLLPVSVTKAAGDGTNSGTTSFTYDSAGNVTSVNGPLSGTADTNVMFYNTSRQLTGAIGPDPDDSGAALYEATRVTYDSAQRAYLVENGTTSSQTASALSSMTVVGSKVTGYDSYGRPVTVTMKGSDGAAYALTQTGYNTAGQASCVTTRMNPAVYGSFPGTDACTLGTQGSYGPDRITYNQYDALGRVWKTTSGYGTSAAADQVQSFTDNGKLQYAIDAKGNRTQFAYDGFDRLVYEVFPAYTPPSAYDSSTLANALATAGSVDLGNFQQYGFDANSNVTTFRTRRGETLTMVYDSLNRLTNEIVPERSGLDPSHTRDVYYGYDLFGDQTSAQFDGVGGEGITNTFNALGQLTSTTSTMGGATRTLSYGYDAAGNRSRLTYPDGNYANYYRTGAGASYYTDLNGSSPLYYPSRDTAGRVSTLYRWGTSAATWNTGTGFSYDSASRLSSLFQNPNAATYDSTTTFVYNPASQITSSSRDNDAYAWTGAANVSRPYTANGLNQYSAVSGTSFTYDANGNLTSDGTYTYGYDVENRLVTRTGGGASVALYYDPLGRLTTSTDGVNFFTRYLYDGDDLISEYDYNQALLRRYVHGEGADNPLVWFEGGSVADSARRYLYSDERGSVVAVTDSNGNVLNLNTYDEHGIPGSGNQGRFQYTGQAWIPELGMYYYKARMYSPTLGRFMQTDPIGYGDGMNMYAYAHGDPVNGVDPSGLADVPLPSPPPGVYAPGITVVGGRRTTISWITWDAMNLDIEKAYCPSGHFFNGGCLPEGGWAEDMINRAMTNRSGDASQKSKPTAQQVAPNCIGPNSGPVYIKGGGFSMYLIAGGGFTVGTFDIPSIGAHGRFSAGGGGVGLEGFVGAFSGSYSRFDDFNSKSFTVSGAVPNSPFGLSRSSNTPLGTTTGLVATGGVGGGGSYSYGGTHIISSNIPVCRAGPAK